MFLLKIHVVNKKKIIKTKKTVHNHVYWNIVKNIEKPDTSNPTWNQGVPRLENLGPHT
jgi:hypothetical protein